MPIRGMSDVKLAIAATVTAANDDLRGVYLAGLQHIVQETPADTGRARNNWFLTVGAPSNKTTTSEGTGGGGSLSQLGNMPGTVIGKTLYFTNNLPYIGILEYGGFPSPVEKGSYIKKSKSFEILSVNGFSKQAPNGWVRANLIKIENKIRSL